ncbi:hypothetical protein [Thermotalea metallivorans]|uniref:DUF8042 domain-containing protein n=1 Tax=Thermotalea metallivorans TaxID=520762 RepID=A0A140L717_9FIRM|nr:hypothetical protein [Thermotalea metallivorans]KXG76342.1 hypothetical protein AN619_13000 [Thermotalea metallivorans]
MDKIIGEAFNELQNYLYKLTPAIEKTVQYFRGQKEDQGLNLLIPIIDGLHWVIEVVHAAKDWLIHYNIMMDENVMNENLREMVSAMEHQDYVLLADVLEYELLPVLQQLGKALEEVL